MKFNLSIMKLIIRLLILLILIVMLGIISAFLYSAKYWPDVYNYVNANITIKRIPKLSEVENLTIFEETTDTTIDIYETTEYITTDMYEKDYISFDDFEYKKRKRSIEIEEERDYSDVASNAVIVDYEFHLEDMLVDICDSVDETKLTTSDMNDVELVPKVYNNRRNLRYIEENRSETRNVSQVLFPWVAAIFVKNDTSDQFDYYCDGAVVSKQIIVTAARCLQYYGTWAKAENLLVLLGKTSLRTINENEMAVKIKEVIIHENFTMEADNDIAILVTETATEVQAGFSKGDFKEAYTTGWAVTGELTLISFDKEKNVACEGLPRNSFCAVYDNDITVCPSYGGIFAVRQADTWLLRGIRNGDPSDRRFCTEHSVLFTDVTYYLDWINMYTQ